MFFIFSGGSCKNMKMYSLSCKDMGMPKCNYVAMGESREEVMKMADEHFAKTHPKEMKEMASKMSKEDMKQQMMEKIMEKDEQM